MSDAKRSYQDKGKLRAKGSSTIEQYRRILDKDHFQPEEPHWRKVSKNTITLFHVLIDQDLTELVSVLEHYPKYTEWVCEHFRYAYSYNENSADIDAASKLLYLGEPYFSKQFVRNLVRKLPKLEGNSLDEMKTFVSVFKNAHQVWHPIITNYYFDAIQDYVALQNLHPLQHLALTKGLEQMKKEETYDYSAEDRDAVLDIPYMN